MYEVSTTPRRRKTALNNFFQDEDLCDIFNVPTIDKGGERERVKERIKVKEKREKQKDGRV